MLWYLATGLTATGLNPTGLNLEEAERITKAYMDLGEDRDEIALEHVCAFILRMQNRELPTLSNLNGPAFVLGPARVYVMNGVVVDAELAETPRDKMDPNRIARIENEAVREAAVDKFGLESLLFRFGARLIDSNGWDRLYVVERLPVGRHVRTNVMYFRGRCPSHPWRRFVIPIEEEGIVTVQQALNWINQLRGRPARES